MSTLKAVITVKYGKEHQASLDLGDAIYPYDHSVKVSSSIYGGVLLLYSKLDFNEIMKILKTTHQPYISRIIKIDRCCPETLDELVRCVDEFLKSSSIKLCNVTIYERGHIKRYVNEINDRIRRFIECSDTNLSLHIVPIDYRVCIGVMSKNAELFRSG